MLATAVAALSARGETPTLRFAVLVAGWPQRADALQPLLDAPIAVPSLHVWGDDDKLTGPLAPALVERFDASTREVVQWKEPHVIPTSGPPADAMVDFMRRKAS
jgi:hypothetical protein